MVCSYKKNVKRTVILAKSPVSLLVVVCKDFVTLHNTLLASIHEISLEKKVKMIYTLALSPLDGPYSPMTNTGKDDCQGVKYKIS